MKPVGFENAREFYLSSRLSPGAQMLILMKAKMSDRIGLNELGLFWMETWTGAPMLNSGISQVMDALREYNRVGNEVE